MTRLCERIEELKTVTGGSTNCGYVYDAVAMLIYGLIKFYRPEVVLQTGHLWGKSALTCLEAMTDGFELEEDLQNSDPQFSAFVEKSTPVVDSPQLISIDPGYHGVPEFGRGISLLQTWYPENFHFFQQTSQEFFERNGRHYRREFQGKRIFGIIDGDHSPLGCRHDLAQLYAMKAGMIFLDDIDWIPDICTAGLEFSHQTGYRFMPLYGFNGVGILVKNAD
jgi:hypothetical protein